jgi:hypothetical protein
MQAPAKQTIAGQAINQAMQQRALFAWHVEIDY